MELRQLKQFVMLAETLNFRVAAEKLHMAQPPLSVSIRKLEEEIGATLFDRSKRGVHITEAGRVALVEAHKVLLHAAETVRAARATVQGLEGRLRIGFVATAKFMLLPKLLSSFREQYPEVTLNLREGDNSELIEAVSSHAVDISVVRYPTSWPSQIRHEVIDDDVMMVAMPTQHRLSKRATVTLAEVAKEPFIHYREHDWPGLYHVTVNLFREAGVIPSTTQQAMNPHSAICLVESGFGLALVPSAARLATSGQVVFKPISPRPHEAAVHLVMIYDPDYQTAAGKHFRRVARELYLGEKDAASSVAKLRGRAAKV